MGLDQCISIVEKAESVKQAIEEGYSDYEGINREIWSGRKDYAIQKWIESRIGCKVQNGESYELTRSMAEELLGICSTLVAVYQDAGMFADAGAKLAARLLPEPDNGHNILYEPRYYRSVLNLRDGLLKALYINWETTQVFYSSNW